MSERNIRRRASPPTSRISKEEEMEDDYKEEEVMVEEDDTVEKMMTVMGKAVDAIDALRKENAAIRKEMAGIKAKDDYPEMVDAPGDAVEAEPDSDHDATEEEESAEVSEKSSVKPVSDNTDTGDSFTGKSVEETVQAAVEAALAKQNAAFEEKLGKVAASVPRPMSFTSKGDKPGGLRALVNKAVEADRGACGLHSTVGATEVFGFKSGFADDAARKTTARWFSKMQEEGEI